MKLYRLVYLLNREVNRNYDFEASSDEVAKDYVATFNPGMPFLPISLYQIGTLVKKYE